MPEIKDKPIPPKTPEMNFAGFRRAFQNIGFKVVNLALQSYNFVTGVSGWRLSADGDFEGNDGTFRGDLQANSISIPDTTTANSFHVDSDGNAWWGATTLASSLASILKTGIASFIGMTSLNMKAFTNFESVTRFVVTGDVPATFGNNGMVVAPGAVATHYARALWWITSFVFANNPTFTCSCYMLGLGAGDGVGFCGLGLPTITGSGMTETGKNYCGFEFKKTSGVITIIAVQCDGGGTVTFSSTLRTLIDGDSLELFLKVNATTIDYYTRLNGGALSAKTTLSATLPSGSEQYVSFITSNKSSANDMQIQYQCAAYEH